MKYFFPFLKNLEIIFKMNVPKKNCHFPSIHLSCPKASSKTSTVKIVSALLVVFFICSLLIGFRVLPSSGPIAFPQIFQLSRCFFFFKLQNKKHISMQRENKNPRPDRMTPVGRERKRKKSIVEMEMISIEWWRRKPTTELFLYARSVFLNSIFAAINRQTRLCLRCKGKAVGGGAWSRENLLF